MSFHPRKVSVCLEKSKLQGKRTAVYLTGRRMLSSPAAIQLLGPLWSKKHGTGWQEPVSDSEPRGSGLEPCTGIGPASPNRVLAQIRVSLLAHPAMYWPRCSKLLTLENVDFFTCIFFFRNSLSGRHMRALSNCLFYSNRRRLLR